MTFTPPPANELPLAAATAGDAVFFDSPGDIAWMIKAAQRIAWTGDKNHAALLDRQETDGTWKIIQAEGKGVTDDKPLVLGERDVIVRCPKVCDREKVLYFAHEQVGLKYGFLTDVSIFVTELSPAFVNVMRPWTWICSALVAESYRFGGLYLPTGDIYQFAPDPLYAALTP